MKFLCWLSLVVALIISPCCAGGGNKFKTAEALWEERRFSDALVLYEEGIESGEFSQDELAESHYNIASFFFMTFNAKDAIKETNRVLELRPNHIGAYSLRAAASDFLGNDDQALADWAKLIELDPRDAFIYNDRSYFYSARDRLDEAIADMEMYLKLKPNSPEQLLELEYLKARQTMQRQNEKQNQQPKRRYY